MPVSRKRSRPARPVAPPSRGIDRRTALWMGGGILGLGALAGGAVWRQMPAAPQRAGGASADDLRAETDMDLAAGTAGGPVLVEYASLTCPACAAFAVQIWPDLERRLIASGRLRFLYRDFPLDPVALAASVMVRGLPPERRLPAVKALFTQRDAWVPTRALQPGEVRRWVADRAGPVAGLSPGDAFSAAADGAWERRIVGLRLDAQKAGIDRTPSFVLPNRERYVGLRPAPEFIAMVERARS